MRSPRTRSRSFISATAGPFPVDVLVRPSGFWTAVSTSATPATIAWYLPTLRWMSRKVTNRPAAENMTPATTAPAIRPTPATNTIASRLIDVNAAKLSAVSSPCR